jgi:dihydrofolate reductase
MLGAVYARVNKSGGLRLLLGRWTYEEMLGYWNTQDSPFKEGLNNAPKYVVSRTLREPLAWPNSTLLKGDAGDAVAELKPQAPGDLFVMGSGELIETLMARRLIDEYLLVIHPLVLGTGRRMFADDVPPTALRLVDSKTTARGVVIATYQTLGSEQ